MHLVAFGVLEDLIKELEEKMVVLLEWEDLNNDLKKKHIWT